MSNNPLHKSYAPGEGEEKAQRSGSLMAAALIAVILGFVVHWGFFVVAAVLAAISVSVHANR